MRRADLRRLEALAGAVFLRESARLRAAQAEAAELRRRIGELQARRRAAARASGPSAPAHDDPAMFSAWNLWCAGTIAELGAELERAEQRSAAIRDRVARLHGRHEAVRHLVQEAAAGRLRR